MKILSLGEIVKDITVDTGNEMVMTLQENGVVNLDYAELYMKLGRKACEKRILGTITSEGFNTVIFTTGNFYFDLEFMEEVRKRAFTVLLTGDTELYMEPRDQYIAQAMDLVVVSDYVSPALLDSLWVKSLPFFAYFNPALFPKKPARKTIDVSFVGQVENKIGRQRYIDALEAAGIKTAVFGFGTAGGRLTLPEKTEIFNTSKINLNFSGVTEVTGLTRGSEIVKRKTQIKGRIIEVSLCGGFVLTEAATGLDKVYEIGRELEVFSDEKELVEKVKYYLSHDEEREEIAERGYKRSLRDYNIKTAVPKLLADIDALRLKKEYKPSAIYADAVYLRNYVSFRFCLLFRMLRSFRLGAATGELEEILKYRTFDLMQVRAFLFEELLDRLPGVKTFKNMLKKVLR